MDEQLIGFQAKYYADSVSMSGKEKDLKEAVEGAARSYLGITTLYFYISRELCKLKNLSLSSTSISILLNARNAVSSLKLSGMEIDFYN